ncbi:MAG: exonuclease SbcCD subunit D [Bradymonadia bacterium]
MARLIHIADLHLGRTLHHFSLLEEQRHALEQITAFVLSSEQPVTAVILAGDIFDRAIPPADAITLLNDFLRSLAGDAKVPVIMIPGNHDSATRMAMTEGLHAETLHIAPAIERGITPVTLEDEHGPMVFYPIPFLEPARVRYLNEDDTVTDQESAFRSVLSRLQGSKTQRRVAVAHAFVRNGASCESERLIQVGGAGEVSASVFDGFNYVALGHLHRPQSIGRDGQIQYSGSLLKYSKSEVDHQKSFTVVDIDANGQAVVERQPFDIQRDLRVIRGHFDSLLEGAPQDTQRDDYVFFELEDDRPVSEGMNRLKEWYPRAVHLCYLNAARDHQPPMYSRAHRQMPMTDYFTAFYRHTTNTELDEDQAAVVAQLVAELAEST